jgi:ATP-dependent exoDNAse (exonuclease V) beta subunit
MSPRVIDFPGSDAAARAAVRSDLDTTLVIEAAAGTGKTTELVTRIIRVLATGRATMIEIVAVTFTEKAAGELKLRLREALEQERFGAEDLAIRARLEHALETLEEAHVNTIHGFCAELLRERPVEARVDPLFAVLTEPQAGQLYARAFRAWLQAALQDPPEGLRRALRRTSAPSQGGDGDGPIDRLRSAGRTLAEWRDFTHRWDRPPFDRDREVDRLVDEVHRLARMTAAPFSERDNLHLDTDAVRRLSRQIELERSLGQRDLDGWESRLIDLARDRGLLRTRRGSGYRFGPHVSRSEVLASRDRLCAALLQFRKDADADLAACLQQELAGATERYEMLKQAAGALDFTDLLSRTRALIQTNDDVRHYLQKKYKRIFVDEFQDTDPVQAGILLLLAGDVPGKLFLVGDPKQAIYRFRGTDVGVYWRVSRDLAAQGGKVLPLTTSYRSVPAIQQFVNAAFAGEMIRDDVTLQAGYVPLSRYRPADDTQPAIVALAVPEPYGRSGPRRPSARAIEASLPDACGAFIAWLVDERNAWRISERQADGSMASVPVQPRHVAILFRRFVSFGEDLTRRYVDALEARAVPHLLVGGKAFHGREEVETVRAALAAIEWPDDELSVFATLKGSLFAIDDELLLEFRHRYGTFHPFRIPRELGGNSGAELALDGDPTAHLMPIADALMTLQQLHRGRNYRPVAETIGRLLEQTRAHVGLILRPAGEQALANVLHVAELARRYEAGGGISFRGFIDELRSAAESIEAAEAPIVEEGSDGVRLMTVHKAKGLEFPVVILADLTCSMSRPDASRYLDASRNLCAMKIGGWAPRELHDHEGEEVARDRAEGVRLAYVAATRARDLLVVPALGDEPWEGGWLDPLSRALYPPLATRRVAARGPKCPAFRSKDTVLRRPDDEAAGASTVCPGLHTFAAGYSVVWWDPHALSLGATPPFGVRREDLIVKEVPRHVVADRRSLYDRWRLARHDAREAGRLPSLTVSTVGELTQSGVELEKREEQWAVEARLKGDPSEVKTINLRGPEEEARPGRPSGPVRPGGTGFGLLVHSVLAHVPLDADRSTIGRFASIEARLLGMSDDEAGAAAEAVERVLGHELLRRASAAGLRGACRRETPVTCTLSGGVLVEGVVDLAFEDGGRWTVIDYKTDQELAAAEDERYRRQVALYASAIAEATGQPATGLVVRL